MEEKSAKQNAYHELSKKYNMEALNDMNFDNFTFDINLGDVSEKEMHAMKKEEAEYN